MRRYYGDYVHERIVGRMRVAELDATIPADQVPEHTHDEVHFILVIHGGYPSTATDMPDISEAPVVLFNPPGTTHRDRFAEAGGRFLPVSTPADELGRRFACTPRRHPGTGRF